MSCFPWWRYGRHGDASLPPLQREQNILVALSLLPEAKESPDMQERSMHIWWSLPLSLIPRSHSLPLFCTQWVLKSKNDKQGGGLVQFVMKLNFNHGVMKYNILGLFRRKKKTLLISRKFCSQKSIHNQSQRLVSSNSLVYSLPIQCTFKAGWSSDCMCFKYFNVPFAHTLATLTGMEDCDSWNFSPPESIFTKFLPQNKSAIWYILTLIAYNFLWSCIQLLNILLSIIEEHRKRSVWYYKNINNTYRTYW